MNRAYSGASPYTLEVPLEGAMVLRLDLEGRIDWASADFLDFNGRDHDRIVGEYLESLAHPAMPPAVFRAMWRALRMDRPWSGIVRNRTTDRRDYWAALSITPWRLNGRTLAYVATLQRALSHRIAAAESQFAAWRHPRPDAGPGLTGVPAALGVRLRALSSGNIKHRTSLALFSLLLAAVLAGYGVAMLSFGTDVSVTMRLIGVAAIVLAGLGGGLSWWGLTRRRAHELASIAAAVERIGEGERDLALALDRADEVGEVMRQLQILQVRLATEPLLQAASRGGRSPGATASPGKEGGDAVDDRAEGGVEPAEVRSVEVNSVEVLPRLEDLIASFDEASGRIEDVMIRVERVMAVVSAWSDERRVATGKALGHLHALTGQLTEQLRQAERARETLRPVGQCLEALELAALKARLLMVNMGLDGRSRTQQGAPHTVDRARSLARDLGALLIRVQSWLAESDRDAAQRFEGCQALQDELSALARAMGYSLANEDGMSVAESLQAETQGSSADFSDPIEGLRYIHQSLRNELLATNAFAGDLDRIKTLLSEPSPERRSTGSITKTAMDQYKSFAAQGDSSATGLTPGAAVRDDGADARTATVAHLRSVRAGVSAPVPKIRRIGAKRTSLSEEWGGGRE